jgi:geranylgeranyl diphosphate synthase, type II
LAQNTSQARIEHALEVALAPGHALGGPPRLKAAIRHAVFPGGARIRPQLCIAVARACGDDAPSLSDAAAAAIELLHCASLVHDDLPCFDDADTRRGKVSVHKQYGEPLAVLVGDALIVAAFQGLGAAALQAPRFAARLAPVLGLVAQGVGMPLGIVAGQAWECEPRVTLADYQRAKTGALFSAATQAGAVSAGMDGKRWQALGDWLGEAYQVADDIRDVALDAQMLGKPCGQDEAHARPSAARELGLCGAIEHFSHLIAQASASIPECKGANALRGLLRMEAERLLPKSLSEELVSLAAKTAKLANDSARYKTHAMAGSAATAHPG